VTPAHSAGRCKGFTLVETLVAMLIVSVAALPASLWLYRSRANHAAWERFHTLQMLEHRMNRAMVLRLDQDWSEQVQGPPNRRFVIRVKNESGERRLSGEALNEQGKAMVTLEAVLFDREEP
jgi:prepilin-type N-terminal cleavage/methylation domain-containing protein